MLATGELHSVREFVEIAFGEIGRKIEWRGAGKDEIGVDVGSGQTVVRIDPIYFRPTEVDLLLGDASKARKQLGWSPKSSFMDLVREMVRADLNLLQEHRPYRGDRG